MCKNGYIRAQSMSDLINGLGRDSFSSAFPGSEKSMATGDGCAGDGVCAVDKSIKRSFIENDGNLLCTMLFANGGRGRAGLNFPIIGLYVAPKLPNNP